VYEEAKRELVEMLVSEEDKDHSMCINEFETQQKDVETGLGLTFFGSSFHEGQGMYDV